MNRRKLEFAVVLLLGGLLGFGAATWRNLLPGQQAQAQEKEKKPTGIFSPPGRRWNSRGRTSPISVPLCEPAKHD